MPLVNAMMPKPAKRMVSHKRCNVLPYKRQTKNAPTIILIMTNASVVPTLSPAPIRKRAWEKPAAGNMLPANVRVHTNPANAAARPVQPPVPSTGKQLFPLARNVVSRHAGTKQTAVTVMLTKITGAAELASYVKERL